MTGNASEEKRVTPAVDAMDRGNDGTGMVGKAAIRVEDGRSTHRVGRIRTFLAKAAGATLTRGTDARREVPVGGTSIVSSATVLP